MAASKTALVLVLVAATALGWENIPSIPANRRAEYYLQHDDGAYKFGYDTGEGQSAQATADAGNQVRGEYSYVDQAGQRVNWQYTAGDGGFVPVMTGAPSGGSSSGAVVAKVAGFGSRAHSAHSGVLPAAAPAYSAPSAVDADYDENADASYNFNIDTDSYKRTETSDAKGNIQGQYSYNSPVGGSHAISYIAGEGTGFVVTSDASSSGAGYNYAAPQQAFVPAAVPYSGPASNGQTQMNPDGSFSFSYSTSDHDHQAVGDAQNNVRGSYSFVSQDDGQRRKIDYQAGAATGYVATGAHLPVAPAVPASSVSAYSSGQQVSSHSSGQQVSSSRQGGSEASNGQTVIYPDGSFSFSYSTGDSSRQESADAQNNVRGSYSFRSKDDGKTRKVDYIAGADTGFVATADHLPVAPSPVATPSFPSAKLGGGAGVSRGYVAPSTSDAQSDGSYSFSYQTDDHSHHAASDAHGNVAGSYSFVADDGVSRKIDYSAGADKGYVAKGAHLPVAPVAAPAPSSADSGYHYSAPAAPSSGDSGYQYAAPSSSSSDDNNDDGSYSYSYDTGSSSKQESADAQGNVAGSFSFLGGDGVNRKLTYTARADEGFIAKGDHLPVAPVPSTPGQDAGLTVQNAFAHPGLFAPSANSNPASSSTGHVMASKDGAYSYSYSTGNSGAAASSHKSSSAAQNSVVTEARKASAGSSSGHVMASKDGAYSYSYSTGNQGAAAGTSGQHAVVSSNAATRASSLGAQANDGSYSFSYDAGTHSHEQSSDPNNNVRGSFSYKSKDDGQVRKVDYTAGAATGFVAKGAHLPVAPVASGSATAYNSFQAAAHSVGAAKSAASSSSDDNGDGSYSYSYKTDTSSKEESADALGNVVGTFSFIGGDGVNRKLTYTAKNEEGFTATGDHLPVAPSVGGVSQVAAKASSAQSHSSSSHSASSHSASSHSSSSHAHAQETRDGNVVISKYLPPDSVHKFGYIFDTKA